MRQAPAPSIPTLHPVATTALARPTADSASTPVRLTEEALARHNAKTSSKPSFARVTVSVWDPRAQEVDAAESVASGGAEDSARRLEDAKAEARKWAATKDMIRRELEQTGQALH
jgi:hypothetical protein